MKPTAIPDADPSRDDPNEFTLVERPLLLQLVAMGWDFVAGDLDDPAVLKHEGTGLLEQNRNFMQRLVTGATSPAFSSTQL